MSGDPVILQPAALDALISLLRADGYRTFGPVGTGSAIRVGPLSGADDLPRGTGDETGPGHYRVTERPDGAYFGFAAPADSYKPLLFPAEEVLFTATRTEDGIRLDPTVPSGPPMAFVGIRGCDVAAIAVLDAVFERQSHPDPHYRARRKGLLLVAVDCAEPAATCCCASRGTGPAVGDGADLVLTELQPGTPAHRFLARPGSDAGRALLDRLPGAPARQPDLDAAQEVHQVARERIRRSIAVDGEPDPEHPAWRDIAERCLACGNCTLACPTCFCFDIDDGCDPVTSDASRTRRWSSCFERTHSRLHGGAVHDSTASRYRQWFDHKLVTWDEQFGITGCVGCGRCITWCPVGIDISAEAASLQEAL